MRFHDRSTTTGPEGGDGAERAVVPAWLLRDVTHVPGVLTLEGDRCRFVSTRRVVFDATRDELELVTSRTRRGRFRLTVDGERIGLSLVRPSGAVPVPAELLTRASAAAGADVAERWERLLVADAPARHALGAAARRAALFRRARRPRAWRAVSGLVPRLSPVNRG